MDKHIYQKIDNITILATVALCAYVLIASSSIGQQLNQHYQSGVVYRQVTGLVVFALFMYQWYLGVSRISAVNKKLIQERHKSVGLLLPVVLFIHTVSMGYGYQVVLVVSFIFIVLSGLYNPGRLKLKNPNFYKIWFLSHVALSSGVLVLLLFHLYVVYFYN